MKEDNKYNRYNALHTLTWKDLTPSRQVAKIFLRHPHATPGKFDARKRAEI
jgi:hypothetical protein